MGMPACSTRSVAAMAVPMAVVTGPKRLIMIYHRVRGHVGRILWIAALDNLMKERHPIPHDSSNNVPSA
jgi:hypothetical protein